MPIIAQANTHNLNQDITRNESLSLLFLPASDTTLSHGRRHGRHRELAKCLCSRGRSEALIIVNVELLTWGFST
jgi:hypothetical protein